MKPSSGPAIARSSRARAGAPVAIVFIAGCAAAMSAPPAPPAADTGSAAAEGEIGTHAIAVSVDSIDEVVGSVRIALYSDADGYAAREPIASLAVPVTGTTLEVSLGDFPDGDYAVMLFQDVNGNEDLDRNLLGIPREPWTGSLTRSILGPPGWDDVRFELEGADIELTLSL